MADEGRKSNGGKADKYERILDAAIRVFARNGFFHSRVSEIAKEAGVADGTIYLYFKNKDDILIKLFEEKMDLIIVRLRGELEQLSNPFAMLRKFIMMHFWLVQEDINLASVITVELRQSTKFMREYKNEKFQEYLRILSKIIRDGKDAGLIRQNVHPGVLKRAIFGMTDELLLYCVLSGRTSDADVQDIADQVAETVIRGIAVDPDKAMELSKDAIEYS